MRPEERDEGKQAAEDVWVNYLAPNSKRVTLGSALINLQRRYNRTANYTEKVPTPTKQRAAEGLFGPNCPFQRCLLSTSNSSSEEFVEQVKVTSPGMGMKESRQRRTERSATN